MERKEFLQICQQFAIGQKQYVQFENIQYIPKAYKLSFDSNGNARHTAILEDTKAKSELYCDLERVVFDGA